MKKVKIYAKEKKIAIGILTLLQNEKLMVVEARAALRIADQALKLVNLSDGLDFSLLEEAGDEFIEQMLRADN